jgi:Holliday junction resolvase RusA-like endonuclease
MDKGMSEWTNLLRMNWDMMAAKPAGPTAHAYQVSLELFYVRPKNHFGTGRNAKTLKTSAPFRCITTPDVDKVARAALDALTGYAWNDDKQVVALGVFRSWADDPYTRMTIMRLHDDPPPM